MTERRLFFDGAVDMRLGRWQDVLADVEACDAVICDPPYSARTHDASASKRDPAKTPDPGKIPRPIPYPHWTPGDVDEFVDSIAPRCRGWFAAMTSHDLAPHYEAALVRHRRYVFAPLPIFLPGSNIRLGGDGPSSWTCWMVVARPKNREMQKWGTLPGGYSGPPAADTIIGGKPLWAMRAIVRDYTRPGDLVVDPFCGGGTTALACAIEGRRCITSEMDPSTFAKARARLERGATVDMFSSGLLGGGA